MTLFNREIYFDMVRGSLFGGSLTQQQVDGQEAILARLEQSDLVDDLRDAAYCLATTLHETASTMQPIEEHGKGEGMAYGAPDPETGQTYYGRGYVQLTWRDNYARATAELDLSGANDLEWHADRALDPAIAADVMIIGMAEGWFRCDEEGRQTLARYFNATVDDPYGAREIINGDKAIVPDWSNGVPIGNLIADYHAEFLAALEAALVADVEPVPPAELVVSIAITVPPGVRVDITQNGGNGS